MPENQHTQNAITPSWTCTSVSDLVGVSGILRGDKEAAIRHRTDHAVWYFTPTGFIVPSRPKNFFFTCKGDHGHHSPSEPEYPEFLWGNTRGFTAVAKTVKVRQFFIFEKEIVKPVNIEIYWFKKEFTEAVEAIEKKLGYRINVTNKQGTPL